MFLSFVSWSGSSWCASSHVSINCYFLEKFEHPVPNRPASNSERSDDVVGYNLPFRQVSLSKDIAHSLLSECTKRRDLGLGRQIYSLMVQNGLDSVPILADYLIRLFGSCGCLVEANEAFNKVSRPSQYTWNLVINAHKGDTALHLYDRMQEEETRPDKFTLSTVLKACRSTRSLEQGRRIHNQVVQIGLEDNLVVGCTLVDMFAKCGSMVEAHKVFNALCNPDLMTYSAIIEGYAEHVEAELALECYARMLDQDMKPDRVTFLSILKACSNIGAIELGRCTHQRIIATGLQSDVFVGSTLLNMYAKCGSLEEACNVFEHLSNRNMVTWNAIITGYSLHGDLCFAVECLNDMLYEGINPDKITFLSILKVCASSGAIVQGRLIHERIIQSGLQNDLTVGSPLVDMYAKFGVLEEACIVFNKLSYHDVVSWGTMIAGYAQLGKVELAVKCFKEMQHNGVKPNSIAFIGVLSALSRVGFVDEARCYFEGMKEHHGIAPNLAHVTCMVDILGHAGCFKEVETLVIEYLGQANMQPDISLWTNLLETCRLHGNLELGNHCFQNLIRLDPDCAAAYVLMSSIYASPHLLEQEVLQKSAHFGKQYARACKKAKSKMYEFLGPNRVHTQD